MGQVFRAFDPKLNRIVAVKTIRLALALDSVGGIVLRPTRRKYELSELVSGITPKNRHRETDWGGPQGQESC